MIARPVRAWLEPFFWFAPAVDRAVLIALARALDRLATRSAIGVAARRARRCSS